MKVITQETLYMKDHGATLKHKCGKRIVTLPLLSFSLIFWWASLAPFLFRLLCPFPFFVGQCSIMMFITLYLLTTQYYNSILEQRYDSIWMLPAVYWDVQ